MPTFQPVARALSDYGDYAGDQVFTGFTISAKLRAEHSTIWDADCRSHQDTRLEHPELFVLRVVGDRDRGHALTFVGRLTDQAPDREDLDASVWPLCNIEIALLGDGAAGSDTECEQKHGELPSAHRPPPFGPFPGRRSPTLPGEPQRLGNWRAIVSVQRSKLDEQRRCSVPRLPLQFGCDALNAPHKQRVGRRHVGQPPDEARKGGLIVGAIVAAVVFAVTNPDAAAAVFLVGGASVVLLSLLRQYLAYRVRRQRERRTKVGSLDLRGEVSTAEGKVLTTHDHWGAHTWQHDDQCECNTPGCAMIRARAS